MDLRFFGCFGYKRSKKGGNEVCLGFGYKRSKKGEHEFCLRVLVTNGAKMVNMRFIEVFWLQTE